MKQEVFARSFAALFLLLVLLLTPLLAEAQRSYIEVAARNMNSRIYYNASVLPGVEKSDLLISFRIPNDLVVFFQNQQPTTDRAFSATVELLAQVYTHGRLVEEKTWRETHYAASFEETQDRLKDIEGQLTFELPAGQYAFRLHLNDGNSTRNRQSHAYRVEVPDFRQGNVAGAVIVETLEPGEDVIEARLVNLGGDTPYGQSVRALVPVVVPVGTDLTPENIRYTLRRLSNLEVAQFRRQQASVAAARQAEPLQSNEGVDAAPTLGGTHLVSGKLDANGLHEVSSFVNQNEEPGFLTFVSGEPVEDGMKRFLAVVDLQGELLADGNYVLDIEVEKEGGDSFTSSTSFATHWRNMPLSLHSVDVAIMNLSFLEDRRFIREMLRGSQEDKEARFREYWKKHDPSPDSEFNPLMAEYYRRIDHAAFAYRTGVDPLPDGLQTDRARIYILQGPPASVRRDYPPRGGVQEIWSYPDGSVYVFEASSSIDRFSLVQRGR